jgi:hypothetical protein
VTREVVDGGKMTQEESKGIGEVLIGGIEVNRELI